MNRLTQIVLTGGLIGASALSAFLIIRPDWALRIHRKLSGFEPSELSFTHYAMRGLHYNSAELIPEGSIFLIGDSITQSVEPNLVHKDAINYGIGGDTTVGVLNRLDLYHFDRARAVVLAIGVNDFKYRETPVIIENISKILDQLPEEIPVVISTVLLMNEDAPGNEGMNDRIRQLNGGLRNLAETRANVYLWENPSMQTNGQAVSEYLAPDGLHLTPQGVEAWSAELRQALRHIGIE